MNTEQAKPGDKIVITSGSLYLDCEFLVVECPEEKKNGPFSDKTWIEDDTDDGKVCFVRVEDYKIILHTADKGSTDVDELLKRRMDENLRSIFG